MVKKLLMIGEFHHSRNLKHIGTAIRDEIKKTGAKEISILAEGPFATAAEKLSMKTGLLIPTAAVIKHVFPNGLPREQQYLDERDLNGCRVNIRGIESYIFLAITDCLLHNRHEEAKEMIEKAALLIDKYGGDVGDSIFLRAISKTANANLEFPELLDEITALRSTIQAKNLLVELKRDPDFVATITGEAHIPQILPLVSAELKETYDSIDKMVILTDDPYSPEDFAQHLHKECGLSYDDARASAERVKARIIQHIDNADPSIPIGYIEDD